MRGVTWLCAALAFVGVHGLFMDMYGQLFQIELLDDCSFYVYDRVINSRDSEWCKQPKSSHFPIKYSKRSGNGTIFIGIWAIYADKNNVVHAYNYHTDEPVTESRGEELIPQQFYESDVGNHTFLNGSVPPSKETVGGRYEMINFDTVNRLYTIRYLACKYPHPPSDLCRIVNYTVGNKFVSVQPCQKVRTCDPHTLINTAYSINKHDFNVKVVDVPGNTTLRKAYVNKRSYDLSPLSMSISTAMMDPTVFPNFTKSFPIDTFTTKIEMTEPAQYNAVKLQNGTFSVVGENQMIEYKYILPPENHDDRPFFYYNKDTGQYTPFFLTYQTTGKGLSFTLRFLADGEFKTVLKDVMYIAKCRFNNFQGIIAAAPRVVSRTSEMFQIEIFFFINNKAFKYCILDVKYYFKTKNHTLDAPESSDINSYVHAQTRSTKAANCVFGENKRKRLNGFAFTKSTGVGQLFSLDNTVSSPLFPCPGCDETTDILCDVNPASAVTYDAAYYLLTVKGNKTQVIYIGVKKKGYQKFIEYRIDEVDGHVYFLQQVSLLIEARDIYDALHEGNLYTSKEDSIPEEQNKPAEQQASFASLNRVSVIFLVALVTIHLFDF